MADKSKKALKAARRRLNFVKAFEKTSFKQIFLSWIIMILGFAGIYYLISMGNPSVQHLDGTRIPHTITGFLNMVYFSFMTATTVGYGDLVPLGFAKIFAAIEGVFGLVIYGVVISKLVSVKQETIVEEIYEISFDENLERLRSSLYLFRTDVNKLIEKIEQKVVTKKDISDLWILMTGFDTTLYDLYKILCPSKTNKEYFKTVEGVRLELIFNSIEQSLSKLLELLVIFNTKGISVDESVRQDISVDLALLDKIETYYEKKDVDAKIKMKIKDIRKYEEEIKFQLELLANPPKPLVKEEVMVTH